MCLDDDQDMWVPCTSVIRTSNTGTLSPSITEPSNTTPIVTRTITPTRTTRTRPPETFFPSVTSVETDEPTSVNEPTQTPETATHIPTRTRTTRPSSAASLETSNGFTPTSQVSLGSSVEVKPSSSREARPPSTQEEEPSSTREAVTVRGSSHSQSTRPVSTSTRLPQPPSSSGIMTSNFIVPISGGVSLPSPSSTITTAPGGIQGGALAGIIVGSILGVVGLLGLGAFLMKSFGTPRGRDLFAPRGAYQVAPGGGSVSGRDSGSGGGAGGRSSGMSEARNDAPLRPALRNRNIADANGGMGSYVRIHGSCRRCSCSGDDCQQPTRTGLRDGRTLL
ncbi:hypothetical protein OPQ81_008864 [Rhizoctonia solani]|nr:hypothetical protein OPQ81_008864 [Rhizoctonia solani]